MTVNLKSILGVTVVALAALAMNLDGDVICGIPVYSDCPGCEEATGDTGTCGCGDILGTCWCIKTETWTIWNPTITCARSRAWSFTPNEDGFVLTPNLIPCRTEYNCVMPNDTWENCGDGAPECVAVIPAQACTLKYIHTLAFEFRWKPENRCKDGVPIP